MDQFVAAPRRHHAPGRLAVAALGALMAVVLVSCGSAPDPDLAAGAPPASDRDAVIERWGDAVAFGDASALVGLLEPSTRGTMPQDQLDSLAQLVKPEGVEVHDFGYRIVREDEHSAEVVYTGERCAPTLSYSSGPTSVVGDASGPAPTTEAAPPVVEQGEVVCSDIEEASSRTPSRFVEVDGRWYGTFQDV